MDAQRVIDLASAAGLSLHLRGDALEMVGSVSSRDALRDLVTAHHHQIIDRLQRIPRNATHAIPPTGELPEVRRARAELLRLVETLAEVEHWRPETRERVLFIATRQPASTLPSDLPHFAERLRAVRSAR